MDENLQRDSQRNSVPGCVGGVVHFDTVEQTKSTACARTMIAINDCLAKDNRRALQ